MNPYLIIFGSAFVFFLIAVIVSFLFHRKGYTGLGSYAYPGIIVGAGLGLVLGIMVDGSFLEIIFLVVLFSLFTFLYGIGFYKSREKIQSLINRKKK